MKLHTVCRIFADSYRRDSLREKYWRWRANLERWARLIRPANRHLASVAVREAAGYFFATGRPVRGEASARASAAAEWLARAQDATPDDGVSAGYFPCDKGAQKGWRPSYPETTGYIIPTLLDYADRKNAPEMRDRALRMAIWETEIQMDNGAVQGGLLCVKDQRKPAVFNTGMVLQGFVAAMKASTDTRIHKGARRAADFLLSDQGEDGHFRTHGPFVVQERVKTYNCLCAWPLLLYGRLAGDRRYETAAIRAVEASVGEQTENGWFAHNCLVGSTSPLVHTIGYALQGILEVGVLAERADFVDAVCRGVGPMLSRMSANGFLHGRYYSDWEPGCFSSCLTGSAQTAVVCYRLCEVTGDEKYRMSADKLLDFLKSRQSMDSLDPGIRGALGGSYPIMAEYQSAGYPNWATKYLVDGLMYQERLSGA
jgi:uncharacterized protein YyaL (SSP411 family)